VGSMMSNCSAMRSRIVLVLVIGATVFLGDANAVAGPTVSTVQTWPARAGQALTSDDVLKVTEIGGVSIQPGGRLVSFTTLSADPACNCYHVKLNILELSTHDVRVVADLGQPFRAPMPDGSIDGAPSVAESLWSGDGRYLAYIVNRGGHGALSAYDSRTGQSKRLALGGDEAFGFTWSGSGDRIIYQTGGPQPASVERLKRGEREGYLYGPQFAADPLGMPLIARVPETPMFKVDHEDAIFASDRAWSDERVIDVVTGARREATPLELESASTSEFSYSEEPRQDATEVKSSDGRFAIRLGKPEIYYSGRPVTISRRHSAVEIRRSSAEVCPGENRRRDVTLAYWDNTSRRFVVICTHSGTGWAAGQPGDVVSLDPRSGSARWLFAIAATHPEGMLGKQCDVAVGKMVCVREEPSEPPALFAFDLSDLGSVRLYDPNAELRRRQFPRVDRLVWANSEGLSTRADLVYPLGYARHVRYPLVITQYNDGGFLRGNTGDENPVFAYAQAGFFVLNFAQTAPAAEQPGLSFLERGKVEFHGNRWRMSIQDSLDIVIQNLIDRGFVDPSKVAYTGLSGGANQIDYALANGRRIAAVITSSCCTSPEYWVTNPLDPDFYELMGVENPVIDEDRSKWSTISPSLHVNDIHAAILANVAEHERFGFQDLWAKMRYAHKPMETYVYAGEYHIKFEPEHLAAIQHRNVDWLRFWLQGYEDPDPAKAVMYARWRRMRDDWCSHDPKCVRPPGGSESAAETRQKPLLRARPVF
jgi:Prolyl oligopeptidase family